MSVANSKSLQLSCSRALTSVTWLPWERATLYPVYLSVLHLFSQFSHMIALDAGPEQRSWRCIYHLPRHSATPLPWFPHLQLWSSTAIRNNSESFFINFYTMTVDKSVTTTDTRQGFYGECGSGVRLWSTGRRIFQSSASWYNQATSSAY